MIRPQIVDYQTNDEKISIIDELTKPMSELNTRTSLKSSKDIEIKDDNRDKKKDKTSDAWVKNNSQNAVDFVDYDI